MNSLAGVLGRVRVFIWSLFWVLVVFKWRSLLLWLWLRRRWLEIYLIVEIVELFYSVFYWWIYHKWILGLSLTLMFNFLLVMIYYYIFTHVLLRIESNYIFCFYFSYNLTALKFVLFHIFLFFYFWFIFILTIVVNL